MRKKEKQVLIGAAVLFACVQIPNTYAAEKIDMVRIVIEDVGDVGVGSSIGEVFVSENDTRFEINNAQFLNDTEKWRGGDIPRIQIDLTAEDGYVFSHRGADHFTIGGKDVVFKRASIYDNGERMILEAVLPRLEGRVNQVSGVQWDGYTANWDEDSLADRYEIWLYRNNEVKNKVKTEENSYDFSGKMTQKGNYKFRVRSLSDRIEGDWSDFSDTYYLTAEEAEENRDDPFDLGNGPMGDEELFSGNGPAGGNKNPIGGNGPAGGNPVSGSNHPYGNHAMGYGSNGNDLVTEGWVMGQRGWWYRYSNGSFPRNCWREIKGRMYHFDENGYLMTGWQEAWDGWHYILPQGEVAVGWQYINDLWYYLDETGVMQTGWKKIGENWYYLNENGVMQTGWQKLNGNWYYLNGNGMMLTGFQNINEVWYYFDETGVMQTGWQKVGKDWYYMDATGARVQRVWTPDGKFLGENGAMIR